MGEMMAMAESVMKQLGTGVLGEPNVFPLALGCMDMSGM
jgi:hypothetical protein